MAQKLINPRGTFRCEVNPIAPRLESMDGKITGLVENSKDNADVFLDAISARIRKIWDVNAVLRIRKSVSGTPAPYTDDFLENCDAVINAFGD